MSSGGHCWDYTHGRSALLFVIFLPPFLFNVHRYSYCCSTIHGWDTFVTRKAKAKKKKKKKKNQAKQCQVTVAILYSGYSCDVAMSVEPNSLQWRHNECDGVSNHQPHDCLRNSLFRRRSQKTSKLRVTGLCKRNSPVFGEFPAQGASNAKNVSIFMILVPVSNDLQWFGLKIGHQDIGSRNWPPGWKTSWRVPVKYSKVYWRVPLRVRVPPTGMELIPNAFPADTWRKNNVKVKTMAQRRFDFIMTLFLRHVSIGLGLHDGCR